MVVRRCVWQRKYRGYPLVYGVASWRDPSIAFSDGICRRCTVRLREDLRFPPHVVDSAPEAPAWEPLVPGTAVALAVIATLLIVTQPLDAPPPARIVTPEPPRAVVDAALDRAVRIESRGVSRPGPHRTVTTRSKADESALPRAAVAMRPGRPLLASATGARPAAASPPGVIAFNDRAAAGAGLGMQAPEVIEGGLDAPCEPPPEPIAPAKPALEPRLLRQPLADAAPPQACEGPAVSSARTGVRPRRKSKSQPSSACSTWSR